MPEFTENKYGEKQVSWGSGYTAITSTCGNLEIYYKGRLAAEIERADIPDLLELLKRAGYTQTTSFPQQEE